MTYYDVIIDNSNDIDYLLEKNNYLIQNSDNIIKIDLRPAINNYEFLGSTANSLASLIEYDIPNFRCSRMFIYYNERLNTDTYNLNNSIKSLIENNFCSYDEYPYNPELINEKPSELIYKNANKYKFSIIKIKKDLNNLILSLVNNEPFITTIKIFESFEIGNKEIKIPKINEKELGGITIVVYGFDMTKQIFIIQLLNDYYELPFFYLLKDNYSSNCFIFVLRDFINFTANSIQKPEIPIEIPKIDYIDLRDKFNEIFDQGKIGSCTANALTSIFEYDKPNFKGSRLFLYYNERLYINETHKDEGAYLSDGILSLKSYGICEERYHPYIISNVFKEPSKEAYENGKKYYVLEALNISNDVNEIKSWLIKKEPIAIGIAIYSNFMNSKTGMIGIPKQTDDFMGGHAVIICGFDDKNKIFILRNSWGVYWGDKGYFYLPYDYISNDELCGDLWIITRVFQ
jgi:hypothetical protein